MHPIWVLNWFLHCYHAGLPEDLKAELSSITVADLMTAPSTLEMSPIASRLIWDATTELASATALFARKPN